MELSTEEQELLGAGGGPDQSPFARSESPTHAGGNLTVAKAGDAERTTTVREASSVPAPRRVGGPASEYVPVMAEIYKSTGSPEVPLAWAFFDIGIVVLLVMHVALALSTAFINAAAPAGPISGEFVAALRVPQLSGLYCWWVRNVDHLIAANPPWVKTVFWMALFVDVPVEGFVIWGFMRGLDQIRVPCLMWASKNVVVVLLMVVESLCGEQASSRPILMLFAYFLPLLQSVLLLVRMWQDKPFAPYIVRTLEVGRRRVVGRLPPVPVPPGTAAAVASRKATKTKDE